MPEFEYRHRVRYRECDPMGVAYHTHCIDWFEEARTEALRDVGIVYRDLEASGLIMPVVDLAVRYHRPIHYDDLVVITTRCADAPPDTRIQFDYEVRRPDDPQVLVTAHVTLCFVDRERNRPIRAPREVRSAFERIPSAQSPTDDPPR